MKKILVCAVTLLLVAVIAFQQFQILELSRGLKDEADKREALVLEQAKNLLGDCLNEAVIREVLGAPPVDLEGCIAERQEWYDQFNRIGEPMTMR